MTAGPRRFAHRLPGYLLGLMWSARSIRRAHHQLRDGGLSAVDLGRPPRDRLGTGRGIRHGLELTRGSCLETALVRREWHLAQGRDREVVIGVRRDAGGTFGAHAWLRGDAGTPGDFAEIATWPSDVPLAAEVPLFF